MSLKLKVCGMREADNIRDLMKLQPDFVGFIFYPKSPRFVDEGAHLSVVGKSAKKVGVFVNEDMDKLLSEVAKHELDFVQLHGDESADFAKKLKSKGIGVIKAFRVMEEMPVAEIRVFEDVVDFFLFDTKTPSFGGSGHKFDWTILKGYPSSVPFFLSGGIDESDIEEIQNLNLPNLYAIDVNSRFELAPALKDIEKLKALKQKL